MSSRRVTRDVERARGALDRGVLGPTALSARFTVAELRSLLGARALSLGGRKAEMTLRLVRELKGGAARPAAGMENVTHVLYFATLPAAQRAAAALDPGDDDLVRGRGRAAGDPGPAPAAVPHPGPGRRAPTDLAGGARGTGRGGRRVILGLVVK